MWQLENLTLFYNSTGSHCTYLTTETSAAQQKISSRYEGFRHYTSIVSQGA